MAHQNVAFTSIYKAMRSNGVFKYISDCVPLKEVNHWIIVPFKTHSSSSITLCMLVFSGCC